MSSCPARTSRRSCRRPWRWTGWSSCSSRPRPAWPWSRGPSEDRSVSDEEAAAGEAFALSRVGHVRAPPEGDGQRTEGEIEGRSRDARPEAEAAYLTTHELDGPPLAPCHVG